MNRGSGGAGAWSATALSSFNEAPIHESGKLHFAEVNSPRSRPLQ